MLVQWIQQIVKDKDTADKFYNWLVTNKINPNTIFISNDSVILLGLMIQFFADTYDICIHVDRTFYMICYGKTEDDARHILQSKLRSQTLYIAEWYAQKKEEVQDIQVHYNKAISIILTLITKPPF